MRSILVLLSSLLLLGCSVSSDIHYQGLYTYGSEVDTFKPCGQENEYWVSHGWGSIKSDLKGFYNLVTERPYQAIYIEFVGHPHDEEADGFAASYDGIIHLSKLVKMQKAIPSECD